VIVNIANLTLIAVLFCTSGYAQLSGSAYRALGQPDLRQNGLNRLEGVELNQPGGVAVHQFGGELHVFVADTRNHRVMGWRNVRSYQTGDPPAVILGQPTARHSLALGIGAKGLNQPLGLAVDPNTGNLYVADSGNHRVVRFPYPFADPSRVEPDNVFGQVNFLVRTANPAGITRGSLNRPTAIAFDAAGHLWISDSGNHRVLRYNAGLLESLTPEADLVLGQSDFVSNRANRGLGVLSGSGLDNPTGLAFDAQNNLYVADTNNTRVLKFNAPVTLGASASIVFGQPNPTTRGVSALASSLTLGGPVGITVDPAGSLYVAVPNDNRVMVFDVNSVTGAAARDVLGQLDFSTTLANSSSHPLASSRSLSGAFDVKVDSEGNLYVVDAGNNRVIFFPRGSKTATRVWGQVDFSSNGPNQVKPSSINAPFKIAVDYSRLPYALYVSDTNNHRVLGWRDVTRFRTGDPADIVIGQPDFSTALPNIDSRSPQNPTRTTLAGPRGIAVDGAGNLYVSDSGNNRVLRFPRPIDQSGRLTPDLVIGQADFTTATSTAINALTLRAPAGIAVGPDGNLFVADSGNNRVLEFPAGASNRPAAIRVYGQPTLSSSAPLSPASAQTLLAPQGLYVDAASTLYVADTGNNRVLVYPNTKDAPTTGAAAFLVIGQDGFDSNVAAIAPNRLRAPFDVTVDDVGTIIVSDNGNNRVLAFTSLLFLPLTGGAATQVLGQRDLSSGAVNWNSPDGLATAEGLFSPVGLFADRRGTLYVGDAGNNRVVHFLKPAGVQHAAQTQAGVAVARGAMAVLNGSGLADIEQSTAETPLPAALGGREVVLNDEVQARLSSVGPKQISLQIPSLAPLGTVRLAVRAQDTGELIAGSIAAVTSVSPGLFTGVTGRAVLNEDGSQNSATSQALKGSLIRIFGTGQGPVSPPLADGEAAPADVNTVAVPTSDGNACLVRQPSLCVAFGTTFGEVQFSGLATGLVGIWEIRVRVPALSPSGTVAVRAVISGAPSNIISVFVR